MVQEEKNIIKYIQLIIPLVLFSLCAFLLTLFVLCVFVVSYCICCTLCVFVVPYVCLLNYVCIAVLI